MHGGRAHTERAVKGLRILLGGILATCACLRHRAAHEAYESGAVAQDDASPPRDATNPTSEGGERGARTSADRIAALAFPELGDATGWKIQERHGPAQSGLWFALALRAPSHPGTGGPGTLVESWPDTHVAVVQETEGGFERVATGEISADVVPCRANESVMNRTFEIEIDDTLMDIVPAQTLLPLRIRCTLGWPAADSFEEHLLLSKTRGSTLEGVLNVLTERTDYDHLTHRGWGPRYVVTLHTPKTGDRTRLCLEAAEPKGEGESAQRSQASAHRREPCYEWDGSRFRHL